MRKIIQNVIISLFLTLTFSFSYGETMPMIAGAMTIQSEHKPDETISLLLSQIKKHHFVIRSLVDHQAIAAALNHAIDFNTVILFGIPDFEYPLIAKDPRAALFLPLTFVVWQDSTGKTKVSYWDPATNMGPMLNLTQDKAFMKYLQKMSATLQDMVSNL